MVRPKKEFSFRENDKNGPSYFVVDSKYYFKYQLNNFSLRRIFVKQMIVRFN